MKQARKTAEEGKEDLISVMREVHAQMTGQSEFTAQRVADAAGISTVWLYKTAGEEFRTLRAQLPGSRKTRDEEVAALRQENAQLIAHATGGSARTGAPRFLDRPQESICNAGTMGTGKPRIAWSHPSAHTTIRTG